MVENLRQQAEAAGSEISLQAPSELPGVWDEFRIEQVLTNLLTNALRYGGGQPVAMTVEQVGAGEDGFARVSVRDRGIGIAAEDQARIFEQFERTEHSRKHAAGLGLGLYITRQIVDLHGGSIGVESAPGEGSTFSVELPLAAPRGSAQP